MARFDLHRRQDADGYVPDLQDRFCDHLPTRLVCPVRPAGSGLPPIRDITTDVEIEGERLIVFPQYLTAVETRVLGRPIGNLDAYREPIMKALDLLLTGF